MAVGCAGAGGGGVTCAGWGTALWGDVPTERLWGRSCLFDQFPQGRLGPRQLFKLLVAMSGSIQSVGKARCLKVACWCFQDMALGGWAASFVLHFFTGTPRQHLGIHMRRDFAAAI